MARLVNSAKKGLVIVGCMCLAAKICQAQNALESQERLRDFNIPTEQNLIPDFGAAKIVYPYIQEDLDDADRMLGRYDKNRNGFVDQDEIDIAYWRSDPMETDFDRDGKLNRSELAQRMARRRTGGASSAVNRTASKFNLFTPPKVPAIIAPPANVASSRTDDRRSSFRSGRSLAYGIVSRFDRNGDYQLDERERRGLGLPLADIDKDLNGIIGFRELDDWSENQMEAMANDLTDVLPSWFFERDHDSDGQIELREYSAEQLTDEQIKDFSALDSNSDGVLTARELLSSRAVMGGAYSNEKAEMFAPRSKITSEIAIDDDVSIEKLQVQLTLTHTYLEQLEIIFEGPNNQRILLFSGIGGSDDNMVRTTFSDDSGTKIRSGRAPFEGTFQPLAIEKGQPGFKQYQGQRSHGVWKLIIDSTRSDRFGLLHSWSVIITPDDNEAPRSPTVDATASGPTESIAE
ncbi:MAG: proprotein convertase P-domain-containing protein [Planctomycetales bacterium]|nr:proprotein convertase P-domain-containing protein [Planctomycetales bacterium]